MTEKDSHEGRKDKPGRASCFPVTDTVINSVLDRYNKNRTKLLIDTHNTLHKNSPDFESYLNRYAHENKPDGSLAYKSFMGGVLFTYALLDEQMRAREGELTVSAESIDANAQDYLEYDKSDGDHSKWIKDNLEAMNTQEHKLVSALVLIGLAVDLRNFVEGMLHTYTTIRKLEDAQELEENFFT